MKCVLVVLVVLLASMMATVNSCELGNDATQGMYDRAEVFRKTKVFDTTNQTVPLTQRYQYRFSELTDGTKFISMQINNNNMLQTYKINAANEFETIAASYGVSDEYRLRFRRDDNGEVIFHYFWNDNNVKFTLPSIDAELPNNARKDYKQLLLDFKTMCQKMFQFQKSLSKDELERVKSFKYTLFYDGDVYIFYTENDGGTLKIESEKIYGKETVFGENSCNDEYQKYNVVDGKVSVDSAIFKFSFA